MCVRNTVLLLDRLGFTVKPDMSVSLPGHVITYLGFVLNSTLMNVTLPPKKVEKLKALSNRNGVKIYAGVGGICEKSVKFSNRFSQKTLMIRRKKNFDDCSKH